jgi:hypothetical protein
MASTTNKNNVLTLNKHKCRAPSCVNSCHIEIAYCDDCREMLVNRKQLRAMIDQINRGEFPDIIFHLDVDKNGAYRIIGGN